MSPRKPLSVSLPNKRDVQVAVVELPDGRIIARTVDELETLELEDQTRIAAELGLPAPPGRPQS